MKEAVGASKSSLTPPVQGIIRFGNFEVDVRAGGLRRSGMKLTLSGQPFDVLVALLEKPGQMVSREQLHDKLWSQGTFVDFEQGLNKAINKVRDALGDDADNPRFIETVPRRGYRFRCRNRYWWPARCGSDGPAQSASRAKSDERAQNYQRWRGQDSDQFVCHRWRHLYFMEASPEVRLHCECC